MTIMLQGIVFANEERHHAAPLVNRNGNNFIELMELGQGNGGAVFKALHVPSMKVSVACVSLCMYVCSVMSSSSSSCLTTAL